MATEGETVRGLEQFRLGLDSMRSLGAELRLPYYYALLGEMYGLAGLFREASASLSSGFAFASKNGEEWTVAELHRVQGDLLVEEGKFEQATSSYRKGLDSAQRCGSLAFERRLLARLERTILPLSAERS
jgi:predicted ATPase